MVPYETQSNGVWLLSTNPRLVYRAGVNCTYATWVSGGGTCGIARYNHTSASYTATGITSSGFSTNDHGTPSIHFRQDGRIQLFYSQHNDTSGLRWKLSTNPDDISAFGSEQLIAAGSNSVTYSNPRYLSAAARLFLFYRNSPNQVLRVSADDGATFGSEQTVFSFGANRPYGFFVGNGVDRIDFLVVEDGPDVYNASVYHGYAKWESGALNWYNSAGSSLSLPIDPTACTRIYDGSTVPAIWQDMIIGPDGHPRVLFARFVSTTDSRYMFSRWTGSAWTTPVEVCAGGHPLYATEWDYCAGVAFDGYDSNRVYPSVGLSSSGPWEMQTYDSGDNGATWAKVRDITTGSASNVANARPIRVEGLGPARFGYFSGRYTSYTDYLAKIMLGA